MKLYRNLILIMLAIFLAGVVLVCLVDPNSVMSRIAAGLTTGAFVAFVNTLVTYSNSRVSFFEKMERMLSKACGTLSSYLFPADEKSRHLDKMSKDDRRRFYVGHYDEEMDDFERMKAEYNEIARGIDFDSFAGILAPDKDISTVINSIKELITNDFANLPSARQHAYRLMVPERDTSGKISSQIDDPMDPAVYVMSPYHVFSIGQMIDLLQALGSLSVKLSERLGKTVPAHIREDLAWTGEAVKQRLELVQ